ncbi:SPASM domain-containing protein [Thermospira aquatica]|uniref:Spiro-SPASM protein n=1 Tax=Thermospira aquatica TaxID=2828656 RepID=A0AAX3BF63_9SPIR|nr:SPASM domain-containing protein [Thermospira aquatica]URA10987.1 spiro-SPASM protein [Thermospira aquatica]
MKKTPVVILYLDGPVYNKSQEAESWFFLTHRRLEGLADESFFCAERSPIEGVQAVQFSDGRAFCAWLEGFPSHTQLVLVPAYAPLIQRSLLEEALEKQKRFLFDYTYAELPSGLMGEVLDTSLAPFLKRALPDGTPMFRRTLKEWLGQDLSSYDCNIVFTDIRLLEYRISFLPENHYQALVLKKIIESGKNFSSLREIHEWIQSHPESLRQVPTYIEIELTTLHESSGPFVTDLSREGEMKPADLVRLLEILDGFAPDAVISFGLYGEVFVYSGWETLLHEIQKRPSRRFLLESRAIHLLPGRVEEILSLPNTEIVIDVSTVSSETFQKWKKPSSSLLPFEGLSGLEFLHALPSKERMYIQMTRTHENDREIMRFHELWKDFSGRIIIRKPDSLGGKLLDARVVDLSPVKRTPCLSLQRNLVVFFDGTVPLCRQDVEGKYAVGNIFSDGVETCLKRLGDAYERQFSHYGVSTPLCEACDDWWIFSF